ncbi:MAG: YitT family protein [Lachnospiraceae bacterium]|nr:YitT family protein [Lachnospiraceae bacterium]
MKKAIKSYAAVIVTAALLALNYQLFIFDNAFAPSGINGIATMVQYKLNFSVAYMSLFVNIPLCVLAFIFLDKGFALKSAIFTLIFSGALLLLRYRIIDLSALSYHTENGTSTILAPIAGGVINGCIYGTVIRAGGSTGGTDIIAALVHHRHPEKSMIWIIFGINSAIALVSYFVYDYNVEPVVLCLIYCFISSRIGDLMVRGVRERVKFEIITRDYAEMSQEIITKLKHSATVVPARGMYSGRPTHLLICVIQKHQIVDLQRIIEKYPDSFAYVSGVNDTIGNYKNIHQNLLGNLLHGYWEED